MPGDLQDRVRHETVMDVTVEQLARVYAQAYLGAADTSGQTDDLVEELEELVFDVLGAHPELERAFSSAFLSPDENEQMLGRVFQGRASSTLLNFLKVLCRHGRLDILRSVAREVHKLHGSQSGRSDVEVVVASELDEPLRAELTETLRKKLGTEPILDVRIDPTLLAGFVVRVGDTVYDSSVKTRLEKARLAIVGRAVERFETKPEAFFEGTA